VNSIQHSGDRLDNPIFNGGGFIGSVTGSECAAKCDDPSNKDKHGRTCVAFEHSSQDYNAVASCALAWGCDYTRYWSGGKTYIRNPPTFSPSDAPTTPQPTFAPSDAPTTSKPTFSPSDAPTTSKPTFAPSEVPTTSNPTFVPSKSPIITPQETQYTGHATSQCYVNSIQHSGDRLDNPIFNGGGFIGSVTGSECAAKCDDPSNKDKHGRTCVAFEHSSQDYNAVASCALAWGCDYTRDWSGGKTYIRNRRALASLEEENFVQIGSRLLQNERKM